MPGNKKKARRVILVDRNPPLKGTTKCEVNVLLRQGGRGKIVGPAKRKGLTHTGRRKKGQGHTRPPNGSD